MPFLIDSSNMNCGRSGGILFSAPDNGLFEGTLVAAAWTRRSILFICFVDVEVGVLCKKICPKVVDDCFRSKIEHSFHAFDTMSKTILLVINFKEA